VVYVHAEAGATSLRRVAVQAGAAFSVLLDSDATYGGFRYPVFSPDGNTIAFTFEQGGMARVGTVQVDGSGFTQVSPQGALAYGAPSWMPGGGALVVPAGNSLANLTQVESLQLSTGQPTSLRSSLGSEALSIVNRVVVSPDGQTVAFDARVASNVSRIFTAPLTGGQVTQITDHAGADAFANDTFPTFVSSTQLAFGSDAGGADQVYEVTLPTTTRQAGVLRVPTAAEPFYGAAK
jgi:TolB protein